MTPAVAHATPNPLDPLVSAAVERLQVADPVAALKWITKGDIEDPERVQQVLTSVATAADTRGIDAGYVTRIFTDQIHATEAVEYRRFAEWKLDPAAAAAYTTLFRASHRSSFVERRSSVVLSVR